MKSLNKYNREMYIKSKIETVLFWSLFIIPGIFVLKTYLWLNPVSFFEKIIALIVMPFEYVVLFGVYYIIIDVIHERIT